MEDEEFDRLYQHVKYGGLAAVEDYLDRGGDVNLSNRNSWSLLHAAAFKGNSRILTLLLDRGANIDALNRAGESAFDIAAAGGHVKCVKILLARGANIHTRPLGQSLSTYMEYAKCKSPEVIRVLTDVGAV